MGGVIGGLASIVAGGLFGGGSPSQETSSSTPKYLQAPTPSEISGVRNFLSQYLTGQMQQGYQRQLNAPQTPWNQMAGNMLAGMYNGQKPQQQAAANQWISQAMGIKNTPSMYNPSPVTTNYNWPQYQQDSTARNGTYNFPYDPTVNNVTTGDKNTTNGMKYTVIMPGRGMQQMDDISGLDRNNPFLFIFENTSTGLEPVTSNFVKPVGQGWYYDITSHQWKQKTT